MKLFEIFDAAVGEGKVDWNLYRAYVKELISYSDFSGKRYLKQFMG